MLWRIEIKTKKTLFDSTGESVKKDIQDAGIKTVDKVSFSQIYYIDGIKEKEKINKISSLFLCDPVTEEYSFKKFQKGFQGKTNFEISKNTIEIETAYHTGVMDPWEESIKKGISSLKIKEPAFIKTAKKYIIRGSFTKKQIDTICNKILLNPIVQHIVKNQKDIVDKPSGYNFCLKKIDLANLSKKELLNLSKDMQLHLNLEEMTAIKKYFTKLNKIPTDAELETIAQTWSEHCKHKTFRGLIEYTEKKNGKPVKTTLIDNLLKETIMKVTKELNRKWCVSVFSDNSGIIKFDKEHNICFKVETHNHPSALEPFGGANTGIGGVIRDPMGTGLGSKPIFNTDVFCFAPPDYPAEKIPEGIIHPKRVLKGVVSGVRDYGNKMGIPTINGAVIFDKNYLGNPLVYCGNAGIMPKSASFKKVISGDLIILAGGRTGRDGIHGATFSSTELTQESETVSAQAVQIGNPITEKKLEKAILRAYKENLYNAITDCGAGGLSSAVGELGEKTGAEVHLEKVPLKYPGLTYSEIWISEAQERMVLSVKSKKLERLKTIFKEEEVELNCIGKFTDNKILQLFYKKNKVAELEMKFLHNGLPKTKRKAVWNKKDLTKKNSLSLPKNYNKELLSVISSFNTASKEWIIRQYDHEVQGTSVLKPLVGTENDGPSDAAVIKPKPSSKKGIAVSCGINSKYSRLDPYWMAAGAIDEAIRQLACTGCNTDKIAVLDNFCWGNTDKPSQLGSLVRASIACYDMAKIFKTPFISGKDSLNNEFKIKNKNISIPSTLLISAVGIMDNIENTVSMDIKQENNLIYILGITFEELGGSEYFLKKNIKKGSVPKVFPKNANKLYKKLYAAIKNKSVVSAHDCSDGGIAVALAEMAFSGDLGIDAFLSEVPYKGKKRNDYILFSESHSRIIVEVQKTKKEKFEKTIKTIPFGLIGCVNNKKKLNIYGLKSNKIINCDLATLKNKWKKPFNW